jgi:uncharacterized damage-inducible protein DinB
MLEAWLDYERATLAMKCDGLNVQQLRERAVPPSTLSLLGLVRHMTDVERGWFTRGVAGQAAPPIYYSDSDPNGDFDNVETSDPAAVFALWEEECRRSTNHAMAAPSLDEPLRNGRSKTLRWVMIHMIEEYARHNGHADFLRERIDGTTGE